MDVFLAAGSCSFAAFMMRVIFALMMEAAKLIHPSHCINTSAKVPAFHELNANWLVIFEGNGHLNHGYFANYTTAIS